MPVIRQRKDYIVKAQIYIWYLTKTNVFNCYRLINNRAVKKQQC